MAVQAVNGYHCFDRPSGNHIIVILELHGDFINTNFTIFSAFRSILVVIEIRHRNNLLVLDVLDS